jgi:hypothetical protein
MLGMGGKKSTGRGLVGDDCNPDDVQFTNAVSQLRNCRVTKMSSEMQLKVRDGGQKISGAM